MPGNLKGAELENFIRDSVVSYCHQTCTAKMGRDSMSVVDGSLKVYGIENLRIADGSIMPRVTTGNTMAACVIIGERAGELLCTAHKLSGARGTFRSRSCLALICQGIPEKDRQIQKRSKSQ